MANIDLKKIAQESTTLAEIMVGRDKLDTEEIISKFPNGFHIDEVEYVTIQKTVTEKGSDEKKTVTDEFWAFHFVESPSTFSFAGYVLSKIFRNALAAVEGDVDELKDVFKTNPLGVKLSMGKTKNKQPLAVVDIL